MARQRGPDSRAAVVEGRAVLIVPVEKIVTADDEALRFGELGRYLKHTSSYPCAPANADALSVVLDRFAFDLHIADVAHTTDTHEGDAFLDAARAAGAVTVFVTSGVDPRRSGPNDLAAVAAAGKMYAGVVPAFAVDLLPEI